MWWDFQEIIHYELLQLIGKDSNCLILSKLIKEFIELEQKCTFNG